MNKRFRISALAIGLLSGLLIAAVRAVVVTRQWGGAESDNSFYDVFQYVIASTLACVLAAAIAAELAKFFGMIGWTIAGGIYGQLIGLAILGDALWRRTDVMPVVVFLGCPILGILVGAMLWEWRGRQSTQRHDHRQATKKTGERESRPVDWQSEANTASLLLVWAVLSACLIAWQINEYRHDRDQAEESLLRQATPMMDVLIQRILSHEVAPLVRSELEELLKVTAMSSDYTAVMIASRDRTLVFQAGETEALGKQSSYQSGSFLDKTGFRLVEVFELDPISTAALDEDDPFAAGGEFVAVLLLSRVEFDDLCQTSARLRTLLAAGGALVLICVGLAWRATVRLAGAHGRARVLETEARHLRELGQAAAGLAHETRNPLGLVRGWTQRLAQSELHSVEQQQHAQAVVEECDRVTARINQFLAFARPPEPILEEVDLEEVIDELAVILQPDLDDKDLSLERVSPDSVPLIRADREMLRQILFNLVQNALQFTPQGGTVEISVHNDKDGSCSIGVADPGPGVDPNIVDSLFTPYFTTRSDGTGLGLAIVRRIATAHGWEVGYQPRPGGGSVFTLRKIYG